VLPLSVLSHMQPIVPPRRYGGFWHRRTLTPCEETTGPSRLAPRTIAEPTIAPSNSPVFARDRARGVQVRVIWESAGSNYVSNVQLS
jgi:hypothetical protein